MWQFKMLNWGLHFDFVLKFYSFAAVCCTHKGFALWTHQRLCLWTPQGAPPLDPVYFHILIKGFRTILWFSNYWVFCDFSNRILNFRIFCYFEAFYTAFWIFEFLTILTLFKLDFGFSFFENNLVLFVRKIFFYTSEVNLKIFILKSHKDNVLFIFLV